MRVYRLEKKYSREGIYMSGIVATARDNVNAGRDWGNEEPDPYRHPCPQDDVPGLGWDFDRDLHCCFTSLARLVRWFDSEEIRREMVRLGAVVAVYEVDESLVHVGRWQDMFPMSKAVRKTTVRMPLAA